MSEHKNETSSYFGIDHEWPRFYMLAGVCKVIALSEFFRNAGIAMLVVVFNLVFQFCRDG